MQNSSTEKEAVPDELAMRAQALHERYLGNFEFGLYADLLDDLMIRSLIYFSLDLSERETDRESCLDQAERLLGAYENHHKRTCRAEIQAEPKQKVH